MSSVLRKGKKSKIAVPCPNIVKSYSAGMGGVDLRDQRIAAYHISRKSAGGRYYLRMFFDLMDIACVNAYLVCKIIDPKAMDLLDFKQVIAKGLIGNCRSRNPAPYKQLKRSSFPTSVPTHLPDVDTVRYCAAEGKENKIYIRCNTCGFYLCLVTGAQTRNCFAKYHYGHSIKDSLTLCMCRNLFFYYNLVYVL